MARVEKVAETIRKEISIILHDELKDPRLGFVTITAVELTKDLRSAKVFYSVLGSEQERQNTKVALDSSLGFIRKLVSERIQLRFAPELMFREDRSTEYGAKIEEILSEIKKENHEPKKNNRANKKKS